MQTKVALCSQKPAVCLSLAQSTFHPPPRHHLRAMCSCFFTFRYSCTAPGKPWHKPEASLEPCTIPLFIPFHVVHGQRHMHEALLLKGRRHCVPANPPQRMHPPAACHRLAALLRQASPVALCSSGALIPSFSLAQAAFSSSGSLFITSPRPLWALEHAALSALPPTLAA